MQFTSFNIRPWTLFARITIRVLRDTSLYQIVLCFSTKSKLCLCYVYGLQNVKVKVKKNCNNSYILKLTI